MAACITKAVAAALLISATVIADTPPSAVQTLVPALVPAPGPKVTVAVDQGKWISQTGSSQKQRRIIRRISDQMFTMRRAQSDEQPRVYRLFADNSYRNTKGDRFVIHARGQATWTATNGHVTAYHLYW